MDKTKAIIRCFFELLVEIIQGFKTIIKEINKLLPELENLIIRIISYYGWIVILIYIIHNNDSH